MISDYTCRKAHYLHWSACSAKSHILETRKGWMGSWSMLVMRKRTVRFLQCFGKSEQQIISHMCRSQSGQVLIWHSKTWSEDWIIWTHHGGLQLARHWTIPGLRASNPLTSSITISMEMMAHDNLLGVDTLKSSVHKLNKASSSQVIVPWFLRLPR